MKEPTQSSDEITREPSILDASTQQTTKIDIKLLELKETSVDAASQKTTKVNGELIELKETFADTTTIKINDIDIGSDDSSVKVITNFKTRMYNNLADVKFRKLTSIDHEWKHLTNIGRRDVINNTLFKSVKARLNCFDCGIFTVVAD